MLEKGTLVIILGTAPKMQLKNKFYKFYTTLENNFIFFIHEHFKFSDMCPFRNCIFNDKRSTSLVNDTQNT